MNKRRGVMLADMLTVMLMMSVGGSLMTMGIASIIKSQRRLADFGNQYARIHDFLRTFARDVRHATAALLQADGGEGNGQSLVLGAPPSQVTYRFFDNRVERDGPSWGVAAKLWSPLSAKAAVSPAHPSSPFESVHLTVFWLRTDKQDPQPMRRFDMVVRCAAELTPTPEDDSHASR